MRKRLFDILDKIYPCYAIGEHKGKCDSPYIVMKFDSQLVSISNSGCGWQMLTIFLYAPLGDITVLDDMTIPIKNALKNIVEFTGEISPEEIEEEKEAYFKILKFRIPKEV